MTMPGGNSLNYHNCVIRIEGTVTEFFLQLKVELRANGVILPETELLR